MKKYIREIEVEAMPVTKGEAFLMGVLRESVPVGHEFDLQGYYIKYPDGHEVWMMRDEFEEKYKDLDSYHEGVKAEIEGLTSRLDKMSELMASERFKKLDDQKKAMLYVQTGVISDYKNILNLIQLRSSGKDVKCENLDFASVIHLLLTGFAVRRKSWGKGVWVFKQESCRIDREILPDMQSLPKSVKNILLKGKGNFSFNDQCIIYNEDGRIADSWTPSVSDIFACDWEVIN